MIDPELLDALKKYKNAKKRVECERNYLMNILPDDVASEIHYNGEHAIARYPEYKEFIKELTDRN
jgi:hypothetical protein